MLTGRVRWGCTIPTSTPSSLRYGNPLSSYDSSLLGRGAEEREPPHPFHTLGWIHCYLTQLCLQRLRQTHIYFVMIANTKNGKRSELSSHQFIEAFDVKFFFLFLSGGQVSFTLESSVSQKIFLCDQSGLKLSVWIV